MKKVLFSLMCMTLFLGCRQDVAFSPTPDIENGGLDTSPTVDQPQVQAPIVRVLTPAEDQIQGSDNTLVFEIIEGDNPVDSVDCFFDGEQVACDPEEGVITIVNPGKGPHVVTIVAKDSEGLEGEGQDNWVVHDRFLRKNDNIAVSIEEMQSDILFVIDNSGSMTQEQKGIAAKIVNFISKLDGLNWRIAITTTDPSGSGSNEDGRIVKFSNGKHFLSSELSLTKAKDLFAETIQQGIDGSGDERGIYAVYRSIERAMNPSSVADHENAEFFRPDAALSIVVISDETEALVPINSDNVLKDLYKSNGDNLLAHVKKSWGQGKLFQFNSIITIPGDKTCLESAGLGGTGYKYGVAYDDLSRKTSGVVGSICSKDYSTSLKAIGQGVAGLQTTYQLSCIPQDVDRDGKVDLEVVSKDKKKVPGYALDGDKLIFDKPLKTGDYSFHYFCLNSVSN